MGFGKDGGVRSAFFSDRWQGWEERGTSADRAVARAACSPLSCRRSRPREAAPDPSSPASRGRAPTPLGCLASGYWVSVRDRRGGRLQGPRPALQSRLILGSPQLLLSSSQVAFGLCLFLLEEWRDDRWSPTGRRRGPGVGCPRPVQGSGGPVRGGLARIENRTALLIQCCLKR